MNKPLVIVLHGIFRTSMSMALYDIALRCKGYDVLNITYPSLRHELPRLGEIVTGKILKSRKFACASDIHFVTHSMGGLISRYVLDKSEEIRTKTRSLVMLVPPNQGSEMADYVHRSKWLKPLYRFFYGPAGQQLLTAYAANHPAIACKVGIIAGSRSANLMAKKIFEKGTLHDGLISHERMKIAGQSDLTQVKTTHTSILCSPQAIRETLSFLKTGSFSALPEPPAAP
jgi:pimeloyl-ACP methyl ester carboxylesterase